MLFNSYLFIIFFLPIVLLGFYLLRRNHREMALGWLVLSSLVYYSWWDPHFLPLFLFSLVFNYTVGMYLGKQTIDRRIIKSLLAFGVAVNIGLIGYYKYTDLMIQTINDLTGSQYDLLRLTLPLGISFYTFQQVAYLVDAYRGLTREYNFMHYCFFVTFFPQLIAGPIVHHGEILPQFQVRRGRTLRMRWFGMGMAMFAAGLGKKLLIADECSKIATQLFSSTNQDPSLIESWAGVLAYTFQIYFDFSGYSDMAIGLGLLFGIRIPLNFNSPYKAVNIIDFWRRWHITLSRFLRDYLYIPLGGNRQGKARRYINLILTMLLGGLWHGAGWNYMLWGGLHGFYLVINHAWTALRRALHKPPASDSLLYLWSSRILTLLAVMIAWVFFRATTYESAFCILKGMIGLQGLGLETWGNYNEAIPAFAGLLVFCWVAPNSSDVILRWHRYIHPAPLEPRIFNRLRWRPTLVWALVVSLLLITCILNLGKQSEFLYWQF